MEVFKVIPALDLMDGQCVRLVRGDYSVKTVYEQSPVEIAKAFLEKGFDLLHVVDLDGARIGKPINLAVVEKLTEIVAKIELGGGLRTKKHLRQAFDSGVVEVILGSALVEVDRETLEDWAATFAGKLVAGIDARHGNVAIQGWGTTTPILAIDLIKIVETLGFNRVIYTDIAQDGMLTGPNLEQLRAFAQQTFLPVIASGGISSLADIESVKALESVGVKGVIVGKAFYEGKITLEEMSRC